MFENLEFLFFENVDLNMFEFYVLEIFMLELLWCQTGQIYEK